MTTQWFTGTPGAAPDALRLFCFPHAGGATSFFRGWRKLLLPDIDVCPIRLPGRETRADEAPYTRMDTLVADVVEGLLEHTGRPYALFGHSLGTLMAYEVACGLAKAGAPDPAALVVAAFRAPHSARRPRRIAALPDDEFVEALAGFGGIPPKLLGRKETYKFFVPVLRSDFSVAESYPVRTSVTGLTCPVLAVGGDDDSLASRDEIAQWRDAAGGDFGFRMFAGGHFFVQDPPEELVTLVRDHLVPQ